MSGQDVAEKSDNPPASADTTSRLEFLKDRKKLLPIIGIAVILLAYSILIGHYFVPATVHPDANGYWAQGTLLMQTGKTYFKPESNAQYIGMHWLLTPDNDYISRYPPGLAVLIGLVWFVFGWKASLLINPVLAVVALLACFLLMRRLASWGWALLAAVVLALNPAFTIQAVTNISHMSVACVLLWGFWLLLEWSDTGSKWYIFAAGVLLGTIPSLRYGDSVVAIGVGAFLLVNWRKFPRMYVHYLVALAGALIPVIPLLIRNQILLGAFWRTGYALTNEQTGFGVEYFADNAQSYLVALQGNGIGVFFVLGITGMVWMICTSKQRATGVFLLLSTSSLLLLYMAYYWARGVGGSSNAGGLRFIVPLIPMCILAGVWALAKALESTPRATKIIVPMAVLLLQLAVHGPELMDELRRQRDQKVPVVLATDALQGVAKPGDVVIAGNRLEQHLDFVGYWKMADSNLPTGRGGRMMGRRDQDPDSASPRQQVKQDVNALLYTGTARERERQFLNDLEAWVGKGDVYVVGYEDELERLLPGASSCLKIVKRVPTPKVAEDSQRGRSRFARGGFPGRGGFNDRRDRRQRGGGMFARGLRSGEDIVIARWE